MSPRWNTERSTLLFIFWICLIAAALLSILASFLKPRQEEARKLDRVKQLLRAAQILNANDSFLIEQSPAQYIPAKFDPTTSLLVKTSQGIQASPDEIFKIYQERVSPRLTDISGHLYTFEEKGLSFDLYFTEHQKKGFSQLPLKLIFLIFPNLPQPMTHEPIAYVIPVNGFGLWDAIYGYIALSSDANTVVGVTWYQQAETAGLGAEIALPEWQKQFAGKVVFQASQQGPTHFEQAPLGITVIQGKVKEILNNSPKAKSSVDGISGASLTGKGVTDAYFTTLRPYRPFLLQIRNPPSVKEHGQGST